MRYCGWWSISLLRCLKRRKRRLNLSSNEMLSCWVSIIQGVSALHWVTVRAQQHHCNCRKNYSLLCYQQGISRGLSKMCVYVGYSISRFQSPNHKSEPRQKCLKSLLNRDLQRRWITKSFSIFWKKNKDSAFLPRCGMRISFYIFFCV